MGILKHVSTVLLLAGLAARAVPAPDFDEGRSKDCISDKEADALLIKYVSLYETVDPKKNLSKIAKEVLTKDFETTSASISFLYGYPIGKPITTTRDDFVKLLEPSLPPGRSEVVFDSFHVCDRIFYRWRDNTPPVPQNSEFGLEELYVTRKEGPWKVQYDFFEVNNAIVLVNSGLYPCNATNSPTPKGRFR